MFNYADSVKLPDVKLAIVKKLETTALTRTDENAAFCRFLLPSVDDSTLLFVDAANNVLKRVDLQNASDVHVMYRGESPVSLLAALFVQSPAILLAALFVQFAPQQKALLVAERLPKAAAQSMSHLISVALWDATRWTRRQRVPFETATCKLHDPFSIGAVHTNKVLCGAYRTSALEALAVDATGTARRLQPIRLGFTHFCFATGRSQDTELLAISHFKYTEVRLLQVVDGESLSLQLLRVITTLGGNIFLWRAGLLFVATWKAKTQSDQVSVWHVSGGGRRVERCGTPITHADNMRIICWSSVGEKIALWDFKSKKILVYELKN